MAYPMSDLAARLYIYLRGEYGLDEPKGFSPSDWAASYEVPLGDVVQALDELEAALLINIRRRDRREDPPGTVRLSAVSSHD